MIDFTDFQWREPVQARSRKRVADILDAARDLSLSSGLAELKMSDVAAQAGVPIGSVYQFFPTRTALWARLYAVEMEPIDHALERGIAHAQSLSDIKSGATAMLKLTLERVRERPWLKSVLAAPILDPAIALADRANTSQNARKLAARIQVLHPDAQSEAVCGLAYLICYLWAPMTQLGLSGASQAKAALIQYTQMVERQLATLDPGSIVSTKPD